MYRVVLLTPPLPAAIATIAIEGPDAAGWISERLSLNTPIRQPGSVRYALWTISSGESKTAQQEQVVVCLRADGVVEVNTHGGRAVVRAIIADLVAAGAMEANSLQRDANRSRLTVAAEQALIEARTDRAAAILLDQFDGALTRECDQVRDAVRQGDLANASERTRRLLERSELGLHLAAPWRIVLAGPPNVGKSSLINAMIGVQRSIVHDQPGTTRDWVEAETSFGGWPVTITDTAGLRETAESIEQQGVVLTGEQIQVADWIVIVVDATQGWQEVHDAVVESCRLGRSRIVVVWNKVDDKRGGAPSLPVRKLANSLGEVVDLSELSLCSTSCVESPGIGELESFFASSLARSIPPAGAPVPFAHWIVEGLQAVLGALEAGDKVEASQQLDQLLGS
ncbi:MAG: 50S ribosome-binding GTPase [Aureliella sp.]